MRIRSITCFYNPIGEKADLDLQHLGKFAQKAKHCFNNAGFEVQSTRLATSPFSLFLHNRENSKLIRFARHLEQRAAELGFNYLSLGPALPENPLSFKVIPAILADTKNVFLSAIIGDKKHGISIKAIRDCAKIIQDNSTIIEDGFANLRFAALANVQPFTPFFPAAYGKGKKMRFALAIECADVAVSAFQKSATLLEGRKLLLQILEKGARQLTKIAKRVAEKYNVFFKGFDFSLAPFPQDWCSLGKALELLGPRKLGYAGSLAAAAFLADTLDRGKWKKVGFNGLMLPVLEDNILAARTAEGTLGVYDLLQYSAVCGTGLDTVPLPGSITPKEITPLLLDISALALRLDKPLTARLMPIPGKQAGEPTNFDFDFFANGKVLDYSVKPLQGLLNKNDVFSIGRRKRNP